MSMVSKSTCTSDSNWIKKEQERLKCLHEYNINEINTEKSNLNALVNVASKICDAPISFVTIMGETHAKFVARVGLELCSLERKETICTHAMEANGNFEIPDTFLNPVISELGVCKAENPLRYYAGAPLVSPTGHSIGMICVLDYKPRTINLNQWATLEVLANHVMIYLESLKQNKILSAALEREKVSRAKDEFLANMSHEIRTPLNAINAYADLLVRSQLDPLQQEAVTSIKSSSELLISMVSDVLDFSKLESGKFVLEKVPFDLNQTMLKTRELLIKMAEKKKLSVNYQIDQKIPKLLIGDTIRITQILVNLIGNAIKFTDKGSITVTAKVVETTEKTVTLYFSVEDTGIGIPEDKLDRIFERFEQLGVKNGGTGLGLSITKNLVEIHNGKLKVESKLGEGSKFYFIISYEKASYDLNNENLKKSNEMNKLNNYSNILICEDNAINIKLITHLFKNKNYVITIAENGKIGVDILKEKQDFHLIIMDLNMPVMNGIEATRIIRNELKLLIPIIGFTANTCPSERELCLQLGMNDYIMKTFVSEEFFKKLNQVLETKVSVNLDKKNHDDEINLEILKTNLLIPPVTYQPFNYKYLKEFSNDDPDFERELIELFLEESPKHMEELQAAIFKSDLDSIRFLIHKMKSPLTMIGLDCINDKLHSLREIIYTSETRTLKEKFQEINKQMQFYYAEISKYFDDIIFCEQMTNEGFEDEGIINVPQICKFNLKFNFH